MFSVRQSVLAAVTGLALASVASSPAHAGRGGVVYGSGPTISLVADLPDTGATGGLDLGYKYDHFSLFWMPIWGSGQGSYVLYQDSSDGWRYKTLTDAEAQLVATMSNVELSKPGLLDRFWGLLLIVGVIGGLVLNNLRTNGTMLHHTAVGRRRA